MGASDLEDVLGNEVRAYAFPWTRGIFSDCLQVGYSSWVLELQQVIIGYTILLAAADEAHILNLCVAIEHQRQGHIVEARKRGCSGGEIFPTQEFAIDEYTRHEAIVRRSDKVGSPWLQDLRCPRIRLVPVGSRCRRTEPELNGLPFLAERKVSVVRVVGECDDPL